MVFVKGHKKTLSHESVFNGCLIESNFEFRIYFLFFNLYSVGVMPCFFLKILLKYEKDSIPAMEHILAAG